MQPEHEKPKRDDNKRKRGGIPRWQLVLGVVIVGVLLIQMFGKLFYDPYMRQIQQNTASAEQTGYVLTWDTMRQTNEPLEKTGTALAGPTQTAFAPTREVLSITVASFFAPSYTEQAATQAFIAQTQNIHEYELTATSLVFKVTQTEYMKQLETQVFTTPPAGSR